MPSFETATDSDLVAAFREGDADAFAEIYDRHAAPVFTCLLATQTREEAADSTFNVFVEAAGRLGDDPPEDLSDWLLGLARQEGGVPSPAEAPGDTVSTPPALRARVLTYVDEATAAPRPRRVGTPEWMMLGVFALVTLALGLIGIGVAAQFEPVFPPETVPTAEGPTVVPGAGSTTTSTPRSVSSTQGTRGSTTSVTAGGAPAALEASTDTINLDGDATVGEFDLTNKGGRAGQWTLAVSTDAIAVSSGQGDLGAGETVTIEMSLDRERIEEGDFSETITVSWDGGELAVGVVGTQETNPIIHNPQVNPSSVEASGAPECTNTLTTVSARITDGSPLESVVARWSPDGSVQQETPMTQVGGEVYEAVVGPFTIAQAADVRVVAFDDRGNAGGASAILTVIACP